MPSTLPSRRQKRARPAGTDSNRRLRPRLDNDVAIHSTSASTNNHFDEGSEQSTLVERSRGACKSVSPGDADYMWFSHFMNSAFRSPIEQNSSAAPQMHVFPFSCDTPSPIPNGSDSGYSFGALDAKQGSHQTAEAE